MDSLYSVGSLASHCPPASCSPLKLVNLPLLRTTSILKGLCWLQSKQPGKSDTLHLLSVMFIMLSCCITPPIPKTTVASTVPYIYIILNIRNKCLNPCSKSPAASPAPAHPPAPYLSANDRSRNWLITGPRKYESAKEILT